jgi:hypothetical protein
MKKQSIPITETEAMLAEMAAENEAWNRAAGGSVTDLAAGWIGTKYLASVREQLAGDLDSQERYKLLRQAVSDVVALQRGGHSADRLQLDREKLEWEQEKHRAAVAAAQPAVQKMRDPKAPLSEEDRRAIVSKIDEIMGLKPLNATNDG